MRQTHIMRNFEIQMLTRQGSQIVWNICYNIFAFYKMLKKVDKKMLYVQNFNSCVRCVGLCAGMLGTQRISDQDLNKAIQSLLCVYQLYIWPTA